MERLSFCLLWGFFFGMQMVIISCNIFEFKKKKRTDIFKESACIIILYMLLIYCNTSGIYSIKFLVSIVFEMGILFFMIIAFTKSRNIVVDAMIYTIAVWICNIFWYAISFLNNDFTKAASYDDYSLNDFWLQVFCGVALLIITYVLILIYKRFASGGLEIFYSNKIFVAIYPIILVINAVRFSLRLRFANNYKLAIAFFSIILWILMFVFLIYLYNLLEKRRIKKENREAALVLDNIFSNYEEMVNENNELKNLKHDLNRQLDFIKELSATENEGAAREYLLSLITDKAGSLVIPASGNIDIDTILAMFQKKAADKSICFEEVIEPYCDIKLDTLETVGLLTVIMDDAFSKCEMTGGNPWIRISIRTRGKNTMIKLEYSKHKKHYSLRKILYSLLILAPEALKNDFLLKRFSEKYSMTYIYEEDEEKNILAMVM